MTEILSDSSPKLPLRLLSFKYWEQRETLYEMHFTSPTWTGNGRDSQELNKIGEVSCMNR